MNYPDNIEMPTDYDYKVIIPGEPKYEIRHGQQLRPRKNTGVKVTMTNGEIITLYRLKDLYIHNYDPNTAAKKDIRRLSACMAPRPILDCPLRVDTVFYYEHLKGHYGTGKNNGKLKVSAPTYKATKPDRDNADKIYLDALEGLFWVNDSRICAGEILKLYARTPRTEIYITKLVANCDTVTQETLFERSIQDGEEENKQEEREAIW